MLILYPTRSVKTRVKMQKEIFGKKKLELIIVLMFLAYLFSVGVRMYWPIHFIGSETMTYNNELMINTNDGYYYAEGAKNIIESTNVEDFRRSSASDIRGRGLSILTAFIQKVFGLSLETIILYLPAVISSLIVIPIILTGKLMGNITVGFFAALLGSVAWSYYNRTMVGYYDTDMFAILFQFSIFYTFLHIAYKKEFKSILVASTLILIYPLFYPQGMLLVYGMYILLVGYLFLEYKNIIFSNETVGYKDNAYSFYGSVVLLSIPLMYMIPLSAKVILFILMLLLFLNVKFKEQYIVYISLTFFIGFLVFGNVIGIIFGKVMSYLDRGVMDEGLHFYQVIQTVREAGDISFVTMANRISGSQIGVLVSLLGYIVLVTRHKPFIIALPLIGVGILSLWAGLRFTVYAVPIAAISAIYLFHVMLTTFTKKKSIYIISMILLTGSMLYPNIMHIIGYKVPTVLNKLEVQDLDKLKQMAKPEDYTLAWWDYGYPIWYYSETSTLIDGGKHNNDNFIISKIMQTTSSELAVNLGRLSVETYVDSNYSIVANTLFKNKQKDQLDPNIILGELENGEYKLPQKTRDIYLYLPYRMMKIFPTVSVFGNLDLMTGKAQRKISFFPTRLKENKKGILSLRNGIVFDTQKGEVTLGKQKKKVKNFVITQYQSNNKLQLQSKLYHIDGEYAVIYMKSYNVFVVMDQETFRSMYVQMFMLEKYDKDFFELVISSPYSKIYKIKK